MRDVQEECRGVPPWAPAGTPEVTHSLPDIPTFLLDGEGEL